MTDDEREALMEQLVRHSAGVSLWDRRLLMAVWDAVIALRADGERIKALEALVEAADLMRVIIENSKGVWHCDFAVDANDEWTGEHCPWSDFECVANFLAELQSAREQQGGE